MHRTLLHRTVFIGIHRFQLLLCARYSMEKRLGTCVKRKMHLKFIYKSKQFITQHDVNENRILSLNRSLYFHFSFIFFHALCAFQLLRKWSQQQIGWFRVGHSIFQWQMLCLQFMLYWNQLSKQFYRNLLKGVKIKLAFSCKHFLIQFSIIDWRQPIEHKWTCLSHSFFFFNLICCFYDSFDRTALKWYKIAIGIKNQLIAASHSYHYKLNLDFVSQLIRCTQGTYSVTKLVAQLIDFLLRAHLVRRTVINWLRIVNLGLVC